MRLGLVFSPAARWILAVVCWAGSFFACPLRAQDAQQPPPQAEQESEPKTGRAPQAQAPQTQASQAQTQESQKHDAQEEVEINEHTRTYVVHLPQGYDSQQHYPVVILLHGRDQDAAEMARLTHFNDFADKDSIIAVYPNTVNGRWNFGANQLEPYRRGPYLRRGPYGPGDPPPGPLREPGQRRPGVGPAAEFPFFHHMLAKL